MEPDAGYSRPPFRRDTAAVAPSFIGTSPNPSTSLGGPFLIEPSSYPWSHTKNKPRTMPGLKNQSWITLVTRDHRAAELVVHARSEEIDVLADMVGDEEAGG